MNKAVLIALLGLATTEAAQAPVETNQALVDEESALEEQNKEEMRQVDEEADQIADNEAVYYQADHAGFPALDNINIQLEDGPAANATK